MHSGMVGRVHPLGNQLEHVILIRSSYPIPSTTSLLWFILGCLEGARP